jgi:hypothetical protein
MSGMFSIARRCCIVAAATLATASLAPCALAAEFALAVSPPRFELDLKAGERSRQVLEITNASAEATALSAKTADWTLGADNSVTFHDELQPGSCRPWVAIERRELSVSGGRPYRFRFEINAPTDVPAGECRFAIMFEGQEQFSRVQGGPAIPFSARLGVVVYVALGGAVPALSVTGSSVQTINGKATPILQVRNSGAAHGRLGGFLSGTDAAGTRLEFSPSSMPILPGETRSIALNATRPGDQDTEAPVKFPVTVRGKLEWGKGQTQDLDQRFAP